MKSAQWVRAAMIGASLATASAAIAQQNTLLDRQKQINAVAAQKAEADAHQALRDATRIAKTNPAEAATTLKSALASVEAEPNFSKDRKATLSRVIRDQIRVIESGPESADETAARQQAEEAKQTAAKAIADKQAAEDAAVKKGLAEIAKAKKEGKTAEAEKIAAGLATSYPTNLAVELLTGKEYTAKALANDQNVKKEYNRAHVNAIRDVGSAGVPIDGNVEFPKDWHERTKNRRDFAAPTPEERQLIQVLERPIDVRYKASRFQEVMDHLSESMGRTLIVDANALAESSVNYDTLVNFSVREPVAARTALRGVLSQLNLAYVVRDNIIHVTTPARARDLMITKVYYLGDLITGLGPMGGAPQIGTNLDQIQVVQNITAIVEMIRGAIDPMSWESKGGQGHLGVNLPTMSLVVRQSQEVHAMIRSGLYGAVKAAPAPKP